MMIDDHIMCRDHCEGLLLMKTSSRDSVLVEARPLPHTQETRSHVDTLDPQMYRCPSIRRLAKCGGGIPIG